MRNSSDNPILAVVPRDFDTAAPKGSPPHHRGLEQRNRQKQDQTPNPKESPKTTERVGPSTTSIRHRIASTSRTFSRPGIPKQATSNKDSPSSALSSSRTSSAKTSTRELGQTKNISTPASNPEDPIVGNAIIPFYSPPLPFGGINASTKTPTSLPANTRTRPRCPSKTR
jgi:hypothetical protein